MTEASAAAREALTSWMNHDPGLKYRNPRPVCDAILAALYAANLAIVAKSPGLDTLSDADLRRQWDEAEQGRDWQTCELIHDEMTRRSARAGSGPGEGEGT